MTKSLNLVVAKRIELPIQLPSHAHIRDIIVNPFQYKDILQLMIEASNQVKIKGKKETAVPAECPAHKATKTTGLMTDIEVVANSIGFLITGNETTATTLSFASYLLALNPNIQEKLQSVIDAYFKDRPVSYE